MLGTIVGSYRIVDRIAVGGMGTVYRAEHTLIGRIAAVKVLHTEMSGNREIVGRFFNEAKATTTIKHPGIVEIFDFGYMPSGMPSWSWSSSKASRCRSACAAAARCPRARRR